MTFHGNPTPLDLDAIRRARQSAEIERRYVDLDYGFSSAEVGLVRPPAPAVAIRLLPDNVDIARAGLREGERLAAILESQVDEIAQILGWCLRCDAERRSCLCRGRR